VDYFESVSPPKNLTSQRGTPRRQGALNLAIRFFHDPRSDLTNVLWLALVRVELLLNGGLIRCPERGYAAKVHIAVLANAKQGRFADDPKFSLFHAPSLRRPPMRSRGRKIETASLPGIAFG
jgi:hypothetical protein